MIIVTYSDFFAMGFDTAATTYVINYVSLHRNILNFMTDDSWTNEEDNAETVVVIRDHRAGPLPDMSNMLSISDAPFDFVPALTILGPDDVLPESIQIVTVADGTSERLYASRIMQTMARVMLKRL
jgi:hypothetical protein